VSESANEALWELKEERRQAQILVAHNQSRRPLRPRRCTLSAGPWPLLGLGDALSFLANAATRKG
jgi:hypothetical protein